MLCRWRDFENVCALVLESHGIAVQSGFSCETGETTNRKALVLARLCDPSSPQGSFLLRDVLVDAFNVKL
jgi:hypothetical protein